MRVGFEFTLAFETPDGRALWRSPAAPNKQVNEGWQHWIEAIYDSGGKGGAAQCGLFGGVAFLHDLDTVSTADWSLITDWTNHSGLTTFELAPSGNLVRCQRALGGGSDLIGVCPRFSNDGGVAAILVSGAFIQTGAGELLAEANMTTQNIPVDVDCYVEMTCAVLQV